MSDEYDILIELSADDMKKAADEREHRDAEITRLRERLAEADEANRRVSDENEKLRFERDTIGEANYVNGWNDAINSSEAMQDLRAENNKLREALKPFADFEKAVLGSYHYDKMPDDKIMITTGAGETHMWICRKHLRAAAAAIRESGDE